ncbi:MAG: undecaprenyl-phosphate galactose phosphotransferase WbaP [Firmicutes bacterium]|nr:undecaprenyl-phosphate galactose phosphotransferase WbaP [Bacillota bacterium]
MRSDPAVRQIEYKQQVSNSKLAVFNKKILSIPMLLLIDLLAIFISLIAGYLIREQIFPLLLPSFFTQELLADTMQNLWWFPLVLIAAMAYEELYQKRMPFWKEVEKTLKAGTLAIIFTISLLYVAKLSEEMSRVIVLTTWLFTIILIPFFRYLGKLLMVRMDIWHRPVLIVGAGETGKLILNALTREKTMGYNVVGFLDDNSEIRGLEQEGTKDYIPVLGSFKEAERVIQSTKVQEVMVAAPGLPPKDLVDLTNKLQPLVNNVMIVPNLFGLAMNGIEIEYFFNEQALILNIKNKLKSALNRAIKRFFDLITGSMLLIISAPFMVIISTAIKLDSKGPVLFTQKRIGQNGVTFKCYKFRTMHTKSDKLLKKYFRKNKEAKEEWETYNKLKEYDPRVTRVGSFLRRFSLDELPQLINVILGDMSLVGPRPYLPRERKQMGDYLHDIQVTKPGITGLWQVSGRNEVEFNGRLKLDVWYVRNWSLWLDIVMLLKTIRVVFKRNGAY